MSRRSDIRELVDIEVVRQLAAAARELLGDADGEHNMSADQEALIEEFGGALDEQALDHLDQHVGCECEIDWKCGVCREAGVRHSRLDAAGLGPDADLSAGSPYTAPDGEYHGGLY